MTMSRKAEKWSGAPILAVILWHSWRRKLSEWQTMLKEHLGCMFLYVLCANLINSITQIMRLHPTYCIWVHSPKACCEVQSMMRIGVHIFFFRFALISRQCPLGEHGRIGLTIVIHTLPRHRNREVEHQKHVTVHMTDSMGQEQQQNQCESIVSLKCANNTGSECETETKYSDRNSALRVDAATLVTSLVRWNSPCPQIEPEAPGVGCTTQVIPRVYTDDKSKLRWI